LKSKIAVIGANARALAESAKRAGYETYLVDYFSDLDTLKSADHVFSMQKNPLKPNFRKEYSREKLVDFAIEKLRGRVENVLLASSIGSDYRMIEKLKNYFKILGNNSVQVRKARDWKVLMKIFDRLKIKYPETLIFDGFDSINYTFAFPFIIKPSTEKEFKTELINNESELNNFLYEIKEKFKINNKKLHGKILIQEFISGTPVSSSILSNGKDSVTVSINRQLIGIDKLNAPGKFTYCGHVTPINLNSNLKSKISEISNKIISELGLVGSVGIDFVISGNEIYFMEINPRFQDTLESVERLASLTLMRIKDSRYNKISLKSSYRDISSQARKYRNKNLVEKHLESLDGKLDQRNNQNHPEKYFSKGILFAEKIIKIGNLSNISDISDIPREGAIIQEKEPICSISASGKEESEAVKNLFNKIKLIKKRISLNLN